MRQTHPTPIAPLRPPAHGIARDALLMARVTLPAPLPPVRSQHTKECTR